MRKTLLSLVALSLAPAAAATPAVPGDPRAVVISSGSEQAIRLGKIVLSRPFGAKLVDRLEVLGSYSVRGARLHLIRGTAGVQCPALYAVIAARPGREPLVTDAFGTCSPLAQAKVHRGVFSVVMPQPGSVTPRRYVYSDGRILTADLGPGRTAAAARPATGAACSTTAMIDPSAQARMVSAYQQSWPAAYRKRSGLKRTQLAPVEMRRLVADLACLSSWPAGERTIPELATPLFRNARHRGPAFAALDAIGQDPASDASLKAAARAFSAEMRYRVALDPPL